MNKATPLHCLVVAIFSLLLNASFASATIWHVAADGSGDFATLQAALDGATTGDLILVGDGTYTVSALDFHGKAVTLRSEGGPARCTIQSVFATDSVVRFVSGETSAAILDGFTITGGNATLGGGIRIDGASPTLVNNVVTGNNASRGGGIHIGGATSHPSLVNNLVEDNYASDQGGGIYNAYGTIFLRNNTVAFNRAVSASGMRFEGGVVDIEDNVFWGNFTGTQLAGAINGNFDYNLVAGWVGAANNFDGNPVFVNGPEGSYYLGSGSAAIDAGGVGAAAACYTIASVTVCMDDRTTQILQAYDTGTVDVGYHHARVPAVFNVPGSFPNLQSAVGAAIDGDTIVLAPGLYTGPGNRDIVIDGKSIVVRGPAAGQGVAILDCQGSVAEPHRAFRIQNVHVGVELADLTIRGGYSTYGGAVLASNASPEFRRCTFDGNGAQSSGAVHIPFDSRAVFEDCVFVRNEATDSGGACAIGTDQLVIRRCRFEDNSAYWAAGGLYFNNGGGLVEDCMFVRNTSDHWGGAIHVNNAYSAPEIRTSTFVGNSAPQGGVIYARNGAFASFERCILTAGTAGAASYCTSAGTVGLSCSNVWGNVGGDYTGCLSGLNGSAGNISADPAFCDAGADDFTLRSTSVCLGACGRMGALDVGCSGTSTPPSPLGSVDRLALLPNTPNPFNPATTIACELGQESPIELAVFDLSGRRVRTLAVAILPAGHHEFRWDGRDAGGTRVASGAYLCRLESEGEVRTIRMMLLK